MESREMYKEYKEEADKDRVKSYIFAFAYLIISLVVLFIPLLIHTFPPPGQPGVLISFGYDDGGMDDSELAASDVAKQENPVETPSQPTQTVAKPSVSPVTPATAPAKVVTVDTEAASVAQQRKRDAEQRNAELLRQKAEAEEAQRKIDEQKRYDDTKSKFGSMFSKGKGSGGNAGNQGDPSGDSTGEALRGTSTGVGIIGGGLDGRGLTYSPRIQDNTQKSGKVVVKVCVNSSGDVISAEYTQAGSTTTDMELRNIAVTNARKFRFSPHSVDKQCGTISIDFRLK